MAFFQWRRFNFFEISKEVDGGALSGVLKNVKVTSITGGRGHILVGDSEGNLHFIDRQFSITTLKAFDAKVVAIFQLRQSGILVVAGEDENDSTNPYLKIYNLDKLDKHGKNPLLTRVTKLFSSGKASEVTALAVHENQNLMAIGFEDGSVILMRGDVTRDRGSKSKVVFPSGSSSGPVSGLAFRTSSSSSKASSSTTYLYVATANDVHSVTISAKDKEIKVHLDSFGCARGLAIGVEMQLDIHFIMGRNDGIYCYTPENRGQCYAFEGEKRCIFWFRNYLVVSISDLENKNKVSLTIFDVQNKFIAFTAPMKEIKALVSEWGTLFALTAENVLYQLTEKDTRSKLDILFKKNFYDIAIKIAKNQHYDSDGLIDIFRQYGDHLYSKGDHSGAIENYVKTIGHLEPSYVIRRFLDAHRIHNLTAYLQVLHREGLANEDHTTLLLNCYTKLKDNEKLDEFIMTKDREVDFDVGIAIKVCRQAGYYRHALSLAKKHEKHEWYLKIQLEDLKDYQDALNYIAKLDFAEAEFNLKKYGSVLITHLPDQTTNLLIRLCSDYQSEKEENKKSANPEDFLHLFINKSPKMIEFLEHMTKTKSSVSEVVCNTLLEHYLHQKHDEGKIMEILKTGNYDRDHALVLCQLHEFSAGTLYLYERQNLYGQILKYHINTGNIDGALKTCRQFGPQDPYLWAQALQHIAAAADLRASSQHITEILEKIEKHKLMSPLLVINTLSSSPNASLGLLRDYLIRFLDAEDKILNDDMKLIEQYKVDTTKIRQKIQELKTEVTVFQGSKCSACSHTLELPSVHFLCQHSFHQHCFQSYSETENECPVCAPENKKILDIIKSQDSNRDAHDQFHYLLDKADDGFSVVAEYFGRGMFRDKSTKMPVEQRQNDQNVISLADRLQKIDEVGSSEARIRVNIDDFKSVLPSSSSPQMSEGRLRSLQPSHIEASVSEARLRAAQASTHRRQKTEARLRAEQSSIAVKPISDARLRLTEGGSNRNKSPVLQPSASKKEYNPFNDDEPSPPKEPKNPFEEEDDSKNPFAEKSKNPFEEDSPKEDDEDYDPSLNPFA